jgi:hypothetical protein
MTNERIERGRVSLREMTERTGLSRSTIARYTSMPRAEWLQQKADEREAIRAYHDDEGHSWPETAKHFGVSVDTVKQRAYRARQERAKEREEEFKVPLPLEF